ncbi:MAG: MarR family transcriptional regulator [Pseudomonadota bacterium]
MSDDARVEALAGHVNLIIRALLVAGRSGAPAEGRIPFNPLYFNMLRCLDREGAARPSRLADMLLVPRTTISTAVKALAGRGLVATAADRQDGRALSISLTEEGREILEAILRQDRRNAAAMLSALAEEERDAFVAALGKVAKGVSGTPER